MGTTNDSKKGKTQLLTEVFMAKMGNKRQQIPTRPTVPDLDTRKLRAQLMLEECMETIVLGLGLDVSIQAASGKLPKINDEKFCFEESDRKPDLLQVADGIADQLVVNEGTASACGIAMEPIYHIVNSNNLSKFAPGHYFSDTGKLMKPPGFEGPDEQIRDELVLQGWVIENVL